MFSAAGLQSIAAVSNEIFVVQEQTVECASALKSSVESMTDIHPRFLFELLVAHLSDLQQKLQSRNYVYVHVNL